MKILDDLISILNPEAGVKDIRQGSFIPECRLLAVDWQLWIARGNGKTPMIISIEEMHPVWAMCKRSYHLWRVPSPEIDSRRFPVSPSYPRLP